MSGMVAQSSRKVMTCGVETMVIDSNPLWVPVRPSVKRATPQSKNALWIRTTVNTLIGTVFCATAFKDLLLLLGIFIININVTLGNNKNTSFQSHCSKKLELYVGATGSKFSLL